MILLGLTGDIAAGKSTVARLLQERGAAVIDSDTLVHELYADRDFASQVVAIFGDEKLQNSTGAIARAVLGARVFEDARALRQLELLVHPAVAALREKKLVALREHHAPPVVAVLEAVKLVESGQHIGCDCVWWIRAQPETQLARLMHDRALPEDAAKARLANQPDAIAKCKLLGTVPLVVIYNDRSLEDLEVNVAAAWETLF